MLFYFFVYLHIGLENDNNQTDWMENFFGIDIGGTNIKIGEVDANGKMLSKTKYPTKAEKDFVPYFLKVLQLEFEKHPEVEKVGIGIPGVISKDRNSLLEIPNIANLNGVNLKAELSAAFPDKNFSLENDAAAAALGEYYFGSAKIPENYIFITLGTGVGGGIILDKDIFKGGDGNSAEIGHILSANGKTLEQNIGKKGILKRFKKLEGKVVSPLYKLEKVEPKTIALAGLEGDKAGIKIFGEVAEYLGESLVAAIRLFDIKAVIIGGGLSVCFDLIQKPMKKFLNANLTDYYTKNLQITKASLGNNAGILGAASLCFGS